MLFDFDSNRDCPRPYNVFYHDIRRNRKGCSDISFARRKIMSITGARWSFTVPARFYK